MSSFCGASALFPLLTIQGKKVVSVKGGSLEGLDWSSAIHIWTKSAMVPIPEGCERYNEAPPSTEYGTSPDEVD